MSAPAVAKQSEACLATRVIFQADRWWVWLGQRRLIGFNKEGDAVALATNIHAELERAGYDVVVLR
jgi:hypothetical protein